MGSSPHQDLMRMHVVERVSACITQYGCDAGYARKVFDFFHAEAQTYGISRDALINFESMFWAEHKARTTVGCGGDGFMADDLTGYQQCGVCAEAIGPQKGIFLW